MIYKPNEIFLVGDFNQWCATATPLRQGRDGVWRVTLDLPCGSHYAFRYLIDGQWKTDAHADGFVTNEYGTDNSIVEATVPAAMLTLTRVCSQVYDSPLPTLSAETTGCKRDTQSSHRGWESPRPLLSA